MAAGRVVAAGAAAEEEVEAEASVDLAVAAAAAVAPAAAGKNMKGPVQRWPLFFDYFSPVFFNTFLSSLSSN